MPTKRTVSQPAKKRARINADKGSANKGKSKSTNVSTAPPRPQRATLTSLPIELLAEILLYTCSPPTVLAVSRTCSYLNRSLAHNPAASFIWRGVRETFKPRALPEPGKAWKGSEAHYAAFVFDGGRCEVCQKTTHAMYVSFSARIRLCGSYYCLRKFTEECLIDVTTQFHGQNRQSIWVPYVESDDSFRSHPPADRRTWPYNRTVLFRKTDWEKFKRDLLVYTVVERVQATSQRTATPVSGSGVVQVRNHPTSQGGEEESRESVIRRCHASVERFPEIMSLSAELVTWRVSYDREHRRIKKLNNAWSQVVASKEGWDSKDLLMTDAYGSLLRRKSFLLEEIEMKDVTSIWSDIESQLLERQARRNRQKAEGTYKQKLTEVHKIHDSMRCGTLEGFSAGTSGSTESGNRMIFPALSVFCKLPSVRTLKGRPDPSVLSREGNATASSSFKSSPLATSLIISDTQTWLIPVRSYLMGILGYPDGWQSASKRKIPPLERVTARFLCRRCRDGGVGKRRQREGCLDFRDVCAHACTSKKRKITEDRTQEMQQQGGADGETGGEGEHAPVGEETKRKKKRERTYDWKVEVFQKDEKAIRLINSVLSLLGLSDEDSETASTLSKLGARIRCKTCTGWIVMDFDTAIGHAHRHDQMEIEILSSFQPPTKTNLPNLPSTPKAVVPGTQNTGTASNPWLTFERGVTEQILGPAYSAKKLRSKVNYGCKHCPTVRTKAMDFNALRSHAKAKHGIHDIRDEDVFSYSVG